jgi:uncharacterized protein (TIGR00255 family)
MILSMTGFGRHECKAGDKLLVIDVKSVNGKQLELNLKIPALLKPFEFDIRNIIAEKALRGSIDCVITLKKTGSSKPVQINTDLLKSYYHQINDIATELNIPSQDILSSLLKLPEVLVPTADSLPDEEWAEIKTGLQTAIQMMQDHRAIEGKALCNDLMDRINNIKKLSEPIATITSTRKEKLKEQLRERLTALDKQMHVDENRFEQEVIYYLEKLDITEEQIRLAQHCQYFFESIDTKEIAVGKKLGFILQEIGREINTTGSKAYDADIQKAVVSMKDELEKAKEQVLNIL